MSLLLRSCVVAGVGQPQLQLPLLHPPSGSRLRDKHWLNLTDLSSLRYSVQSRSHEQLVWPVIRRPYSPFTTPFKTESHGSNPFPTEKSENPFNQDRCLHKSENPFNQDRCLHAAYVTISGCLLGVPIMCRATAGRDELQMRAVVISTLLSKQYMKLRLPQTKRWAGTKPT